MTVRILLAVLALLLLPGCDVHAHLVTDGEPTADGVELVLGERAEAYVYGSHGGFETQGYACADDETVTSDDPLTVSVRATDRTRTVDVNSYEVEAPIYELESHRLGQVFLRTTCGGEATSVLIRVVASSCAACAR